MIEGTNTPDPSSSSHHFEKLYCSTTTLTHAAVIGKNMRSKCTIQVFSFTIIDADFRFYIYDGISASLLLVSICLVDHSRLLAYLPSWRRMVMLPILLD